MAIDRRFSATFFNDLAGISASATIGSGNPFSIIGTIAILAGGAGQQVVFTSASGATANTITITGTAVNGNTIVESLTGPKSDVDSGVVVTTGFFSTVTSVNVDTGTATATTIGWGVGGDLITETTVIMNARQGPGNIAVAVNRTDTATTGSAEIQYTIYNPKDFLNDYSNDAAWVTLTESIVIDPNVYADGSFAFPVWGIRGAISGTSAEESWEFVVLQGDTFT